MANDPVTIRDAVERELGDVGSGHVMQPRTRQRQVYVYMLVQFLPVPPFQRARNGKVRRSCDQDGVKKLVGRLLDMAPANVRYACRRIEELRDEDAEFDAKLMRIERKLEENAQTR